jgi:hypothetical protein
MRKSSEKDGMGMNQMKLVTDFIAAIGKQKKAVLPRTINLVIKAANEIIADIEKPFVPATPGMGLEAWLKSDDVGMSSRYLAWCMFGGTEPEYAHPLDADDFGRCYRLLRAVGANGAFCARNKSYQWNALEKNWDGLEKMYEIDDPRMKKALCALIQKILKESEQK